MNNMILASIALGIITYQIWHSTLNIKRKPRTNLNMYVFSETSNKGMIHYIDLGDENYYDIQ